MDWNAQIVLGATVIAFGLLLGLSAWERESVMPGVESYGRRNGPPARDAGRLFTLMVIGIGFIEALPHHWIGPWPLPDLRQPAAGPDYWE